MHLLTAIICTPFSVLFLTLSIFDMIYFIDNRNKETAIGIAAFLLLGLSFSTMAVNAICNL